MFMFMSIAYYTQLEGSLFTFLIEKRIYLSSFSSKLHDLLSSKLYLNQPHTWLFFCTLFQLCGSLE